MCPSYMTCKYFLWYYDQVYQGYYNTGWFNSKMRSRANLLICQQINIKAKLKCFSDKISDFELNQPLIVDTLTIIYVMRKLLYLLEIIQLAAETYHETFPSLGEGTETS